MPRSYPPEFRRKVLDLLKAGRTVAQVAADLQISDQTIYNWRTQELIDTGQRLGLSSSNTAELVAARRRIAELETELAVTKRAMELLKEAVPPKGGTRPSPRWPLRASLSRRPAGWSAPLSPASTPGVAVCRRHGRYATPG
jgi:transposase